MLLVGGGVIADWQKLESEPAYSYPDMSLRDPVFHVIPPKDQGIIIVVVCTTT